MTSPATRTVDIQLPPGLAALVAHLRDVGGRPYLVGGANRDALLGIPAADFDLEVFDLAAERLRASLARFGRVDTVGEAFTVYKVSKLEGLTGSLDVSLPRRDSKVGPGHRGIAVEGDPRLSLEEASRRRDFTINALMVDPFTREVLDLHRGLEDLEARVLRAVDSSTFGEDPLRALRAVQLAARFDLAVEPVTARLCASMPLGELPAERVFAEIEKLLMTSSRPSEGLRLLREE